jgi:hypothetical protein
VALSLNRNTIIAVVQYFTQRANCYYLGSTLQSYLHHTAAMRGWVYVPCRMNDNCAIVVSPVCTLQGAISRCLKSMMSLDLRNCQNKSFVACIAEVEAAGTTMQRLWAYMLHVTQPNRKLIIHYILSYAKKQIPPDPTFFNREGVDGPTGACAVMPHDGRRRRAQ